MLLLGLSALSFTACGDDDDDDAAADLTTNYYAINGKKHAIRTTLAYLQNTSQGDINALAVVFFDKTINATSIPKDVRGYYVLQSNYFIVKVLFEDLGEAIDLREAHSNYNWYTGIYFDGRGYFDDSDEGGSDFTSGTLLVERSDNHVEVTTSGKTRDGNTFEAKFNGSVQFVENDLLIEPSE
jgi:hypothetical protein